MSEVLFVLQVDLLKATAVPLMKTFGIDGEGLEIKVLLESILFGISDCRCQVF